MSAMTGMLVLVLLFCGTLAHESKSFKVNPDDEHMKEHLQEHLAEMAEDVKLDTEDDVYFGYFNVHDTDKDGFMDGLELLTSFGDHRSKKIDDNYTAEQYDKDLQTYVDIVDLTLKDFDKNNDGLVSFAEYIAQVKKAS